MGCISSCFTRKDIHPEARIHVAPNVGPVTPEGLSVHEWLMYKMRIRSLRNGQRRPSESLETLRSTAFELRQERKLFIALQHDHEYGASVRIENDPKSPGSSIVSFVYYPSEEEALI